MLEAVEHPESVVMEKIPTVQFKRQILTALLWTLVMNLAIVILAVLKWEIAAQILSSFVEFRIVKYQPGPLGPHAVLPVGQEHPAGQGR